jgi:hypothetical protein
VAGGRVDRLGHLDQEEDIRDILEARARLDRVEGDGWYVTERQRFFDLLAHFPSAEDWLEFRAREGYSGVVSGCSGGTSSSCGTAGPYRALLGVRVEGERW